jgi:hypothetical protein
VQQTFYDTSVGCYQQILESTAQVLMAGRQHAESNGLDLSDMVDYRLHETMLPLSFQVISAWHHSHGAIEGMRLGVFTPPPSKPGIDYSGLCDLIDEALSTMNQETEESMAALSGQNMIFRLGETEIPFTTDNFLESFSKPNFYFHTTTTYAILRQLGTPLGKRDYLGSMKMGH